jgi:hypothetical protein
MPSASEIAALASKTVNGEREKTYGDVLATHQKIATLWNAYNEIRRSAPGPFTAEDVAQMEALIKTARSQGGSFHLDNYVDQSGYAAIAGEIAERSR